MEEIGILKPRRSFEIAKRVKATGQPVRITSRGEQMVDITPVIAHAGGRRTKAQAIAELTDLRKTLPKTNAEQIRTDIENGRH